MSSRCVVLACALALIAPIGSAQGAAGSGVARPAAGESLARVWVSTADEAEHVSARPAARFVVEPPQPDDIVVDARQEYQRITGFGGALTDASAWLIHDWLPQPERKRFLHALFGPPPNLNFRLVRLTIGASDFSLRQYSLDDVAAGDTDPALDHFSIAPELHDVVPVMRHVLALDPNVRVIASPWSAPAWMKSSDSLVGGTLKPAFLGVYAAYLERYVAAMDRAGVPIYALTVQNEPAFSPTTYPGMRLSADMRAQLIGAYLGPLLARSQPRTKIFGWDHNWDRPNEPLQVLSDPVARRYISAVAWHCYGGTPAAQSQVHVRYPDKGAYVTECSVGGWNKGDAFTWLADRLLVGSLRHWAKGVVYWNLALDRQDGPHSGGCGDCTAMATVNRITGEVTYNPIFYAFEQFSRFVVPGSVRVASSNAGATLHNVAFRTPNGKIVLIVVNSRGVAAQFHVDWDGRRFAYTLPATSVGTFVWPM